MENTESKEIRESGSLVLVIDIGTVNTRAGLFELAGGRWQFVGTVSARTVYSESGEVEYQSVSGALSRLEAALDRHFLDDNERIIVPQKLGMIGVDQVIVTWSGGETPRIAVAGLTKGSSIGAIEELLRNNGMQPDAVVCAMDGHSLTENIDILTASDPDIILIGGGTEDGAERAVYRLGEILMLACKSIDEKSRPAVLYMGSSAAAGQFSKVFRDITEIGFCDNILGTEETRVSPSAAFQKSLKKFALKHNRALAQLDRDTKCESVSADFAYGRCIRLLSRINRANHAALGIEVGADRTITAFGQNLRLEMSVSDAGIGSTLPNLLKSADLNEILSRVGFQLKISELKDYILNKSCHPELIPANNYSAEIEQVLTRFLIERALQDNPRRDRLEDGSLGMVLLGGSVLRNVEDPGDALRVGMDSLHAFGMVDYYLDMNGLASAVGAMAGVNRELAAQVTSPAIFLNLGRVVTPRSNVKEGKRAFSISIRDDSGSVKKYDIIQGGIKRIPLEYGRFYEIDWFNLGGSVTVPGVPTWTSVGFKSGCFGLVFDMRGNTIEFPKERAHQIHLLDRWKKELGSWKS